MACLTACHIWKHWYSTLCVRLCVCVWGGGVCLRAQINIPGQESHTLPREKCEWLWHIFRPHSPQATQMLSQGSHRRVCVAYILYCVCVCVCVCVCDVMLMASLSCSSFGCLRFFLLTVTVKQKEQKYVLGILNMHNINTLSFPSKVFIGTDTDRKHAETHHQNETAHPLERPHFLASTRDNKALTQLWMKKLDVVTFSSCKQEVKAASWGKAMWQHLAPWNGTQWLIRAFHLHSEVSFSNGYMKGNCCEQ